jgi:hypothetical protein
MVGTRWLGPCRDRDQAGEASRHATATCLERGQPFEPRSSGAAQKGMSATVTRAPGNDGQWTGGARHYDLSASVRSGPPVHHRRRRVKAHVLARAGMNDRASAPPTPSSNPPVGIAREIGGHRLRSGEGRLGVDEPVLLPEWCEIRGESVGVA